MPFTASYASRVIFIKDGRIFNELLRRKKQKRFFDDIMDVVTMLGGELNDAFKLSLKILLKVLRITPSISFSCMLGVAIFYVFNTIESEL